MLFVTSIYGNKPNNTLLHTVADYYQQFYKIETENVKYHYWQLGADHDRRIKKNVVVMVLREHFEHDLRTPNVLCYNTAFCEQLSRKTAAEEISLSAGCQAPCPVRGQTLKSPLSNLDWKRPAAVAQNTTAPGTNNQSQLRHYQQLTNQRRCYCETIPTRLCMTNSC